MATKGFTKINNSIIFDTDLSLEAIGLYVKLQHLSNIDNFSIKRAYIKSISGYGETAFRRVWKELKDKGVLIEIKTSNKGRYEYSYVLKANEDTENVVSKEEKKPKHVDSDGNKPINGQININDIMEGSSSNEDIEVVAEITGLNKLQSAELLRVANNDVDKVIGCYNYTIRQSNVKNLFSYTVWAIKNNKLLNIGTELAERKKSTFNNYPQRTYNFDKLERALIYGEEYELPIGG